jgi:hypothetical protein
MNLPARTSTHAAALALALLPAACQLAVAQEAKPVTANQPFTLRVGGTALLAQPPVLLGLEAVASDSRCPKGAQCVWAGLAAVRVWWREGTGPTQQAELRSAPGPGAAGAAGAAADLAAVGGMTLRLQRVDPYPVAGRPVLPADYTVTLVLTPGRETPVAR